MKINNIFRMTEARMWNDIKISAGDLLVTGEDEDGNMTAFVLSEVSISSCSQFNNDYGYRNNMDMDITFSSNNTFKNGIINEKARGILKSLDIKTISNK